MASKAQYVYTALCIIVLTEIVLQVRSAILGTDNVAIPSRHSAYRMLVPAEKINSSSKLRDLGLLEPRISIIHDNERRIICYPCRNSSLLNFVCALR
jgi:hypothetical protein